jgi:hypothetical protein
MTDKEDKKPMDPSFKEALIWKHSVAMEGILKEAFKRAAVVAFPTMLHSAAAELLPILEHERNKIADWLEDQTKWSNDYNERTLRSVAAQIRMGQHWKKEEETE